MDKHNVKLFAVGDVGLIGQVASNVDVFGPQHPFSLVSEYLNKADILFGNLEMPFSEEGNNSIQSHQSRDFHHQDRDIDSLVQTGFSVMSIGNNHIMECGDEGLEKTIRTLQAHRIKHIGAGKNIDEARKSYICNVNGVRVGFLAYSMPSTDSATKTKPGPAPIILSYIIEDIQDLKKQVDFTVVSLHLGMMYMETPAPEDVNTCRAIIDCGADVILGHHPHVLQGVDQYNGGVIFYSLGEFMFDRKAGARFVSLGSESRRNSMIVELIFEKNHPVQYKITPTYLNDDYQVEIVIGEARRAKIDDINRLSSKLSNTNQFYQEAGTKLVGYELGGLLHHLRKGNIKYVFSKLLNLRVRHFKLFLGFIRRKIS